MTFGDHEKRFGKYTYHLLNTARTLTDAKKMVKDAREYGFARVRFTVKSGVPQSTNKYWIWGDGLKRKGRKNLWNPATAQWVE